MESVRDLHLSSKTVSINHVQVFSFSIFQLNGFSYSIILVFSFDLLFFAFLVDGKFSDWTSGACKTNKGDTCGVGKKGTLKRTRTCTSPKPQFGGKDCEGENETIEECTLEPCPRNATRKMFLYC